MNKEYPTGKYCTCRNNYIDPWRQISTKNKKVRASTRTSKKISSKNKKNERDIEYLATYTNNVTMKLLRHRNLTKFRVGIKPTLKKVDLI